MDIDTYLRRNELTAAEFAGRLGISEASLSRIRRGDQNIGRATIRQIVEASGGQVTVEALVFGDHGATDIASANTTPHGNPRETSGEAA